jgi:hypothetical protein
VRAKHAREHCEQARAAGNGECCRCPRAIDDQSRAGRAHGTADCHRRGQPRESLGDGALRDGAADHRVQAGLGRRNRGTGDEQDRSERQDASVRRD